eukprot:scaffold78593_cov66-Phaeocystis_antarctica.AAC.2
MLSCRTTALAVHAATECGSASSGWSSASWDSMSAASRERERGPSSALLICCRSFTANIASANVVSSTRPAVLLLQLPLSEGGAVGARPGVLLLTLPLSEGAAEAAMGGAGSPAVLTEDGALLADGGLAKFGHHGGWGRR